MPSSKNTSPDTSPLDQFASFIRFVQENRGKQDEIDEQVSHANREQALKNDYLEVRNQQVRDYSELRKTYGKAVAAIKFL